MRYLTLPIHFLKFWYVESLIVFLRTWKNLILYLEEDLAVGLMWKLLFVPLFHDSSFVGRILSLIFRTSRILMGLFAFALATAAALTVALFFLLSPFLIFIPTFDFLNILAKIVVFSGVGLFLIHTFTHPHKKVWQIREGSDFWLSSKIKKKKLSVNSLFNDIGVKSLLSYLELKSEPQISGADLDIIGSEAFNLAKKSGSEYIDAEHFFVASLINTPNIENDLLQSNLTTEDFVGALNYLEKRKNKWRRVYLWDDDFSIHHLKGINRGWLGVPTPALDLYSLDLTRQAAKVGFPNFYGRQAVVTEILNILSSQGKRNVVIVAPAGAGKSALIKFLSKQILAGDAPPSLATKRLVNLDLTRLLSGVTSQGNLAERVKNIFEEISLSGNIILVVEEIHNLGLGEVGSQYNLYSLLEPFLDSTNYQFIATTEAQNYTKTLEKNSSLANIFTKIELPPATTDETIEILEEKAIEIERKNKIRVSFLAIKGCVELSSKLLHDKVLPDSALTILDEAQTQISGGWISIETIKEVISKRVNVPVLELGNVQKEKLLNLEEEIHQRLIDQEEAVKVVADTLRRSAAGLREENRPIGSFLFVGPTGVGKTELAKILSEIYFKGQGAFVRFDMSEYQTSESVSRLIGGSENSGELTEAIRNKPYALILLDEFEKADPKILTLFLQVLEDGRLTDASGKLIDFTNTIIIATSNTASLTIAQGLNAGKSMSEIDKVVSEELLKVFKPELINRFDDVVIFKPLSENNLQKIVTLKLENLKTKMKEKGYLIEFDQGLLSELSKKGFDQALGARPLRRLIQDTMEANLSKMILESKLTKGQTFKVGVEVL